jgi:ribonucleoside-diphosphate reductase alpha chain
MNNSNKLLSDIVAFRTYAKFLSHLGRRETLEETINRNMQMHLQQFPKLSRDIIKSYQRVHELKVMPSMRGLQFSGDAILKNHARQYNCSYAPIDNTKIFSEAMFLLLSGVGFGFSVQKRHVNQLPKLQEPREEGLYVIHDSIQGWAESVNVLIEAYFYGKIKPQFDFTKIRPKGSYLVTTGAKAPGSEPLKKMLELVENKLKIAINRKLKPIEAHDIVCIISDAVLAGGIRRAALISLFDRDDDEMLKSKHGDWWNTAPWRARANNSAILPRKEVTKDEFDYIFKMCQESGSGEPGFSWTNNPDGGFNPCHEIYLNPNQFCNLTTINQTGITSEKDFLNRVYAAALIGTLQASYTDFSYLRPTWRETTEREALLGVSFTGIADSRNIINAELLRKGASLVLEVNEKYAKKIGINPAARTTAIKPEGTSSCVLGSSSGIHARHSAFYIRRIRMNKDDALAVYLKSVIPELVEDDVTSATGVVVSIPQESPEGAIVRENETALSLLNRSLYYSRNWVNPGHVSGDNKHNVSVTISVKDDEWVDLREAMWDNRELYSGISLLPYFDANYKQMPFEECNKDTFEKMSKNLKELDLKQVKEEKDNTSRIEQLACVNGVCSLD